MSKLTTAILGSALFLYAAGTFAAVPVTPVNSSVQHIQGDSLKSKATKATKKHTEKKVVRKAKKKAVHTLVK
ncbi:hypothetical protein D3C81_2124530 [compost metagenome]